MYNTVMRQKDFSKRTWLNPTGACAMTIHVDTYSAEFSIRDCSRSITIHSSHMEEYSYKKEKGAFLRKLYLIRKMLLDLEDEVVRRWP